jgi:hypothetical protein
VRTPELAPRQLPQEGAGPGRIAGLNPTDKARRSPGSEPFVRRRRTVQVRRCASRDGRAATCPERDDRRQRKWHRAHRYCSEGHTRTTFAQADRHHRPLSNRCGSPRHRPDAQRASLKHLAALLLRPVEHVQPMRIEVDQFFASSSAGRSAGADSEVRFRVRWSHLAPVENRMKYRVETVGIEPTSAGA